MSLRMSISRLPERKTTLKPRVLSFRSLLALNRLSGGVRCVSADPSRYQSDRFEFVVDCGVEELGRSTRVCRADVDIRQSYTESLQVGAGLPGAETTSSSQTTYYEVSHSHL